MASIYKAKTDVPLHRLIADASNSQGASILIPDLQRPYVWSPLQVTLLLDSLIRGWPFGTLLMWKVEGDRIAEIPHRPFWSIADSTGTVASSSYPTQNPPGNYHMVLDGQQRLQSLLLAVHGDNSGFRLHDRRWAEVLEDTRRRGRQGKHRHWSLGSLCFDLMLFQEEYERMTAEHTTLGLAPDVSALDYQRILVWCVTNQNEGRSPWAKPDTYQEVLPTSFAAENRGRFIRFSRLWDLAGISQNTKEGQFRALLSPQLKEHGVAQAQIDDIVAPLAEFVSTLRDLKLAEVAFLEIQPFAQPWTEDGYNEAVVTIFTRLNTAGRTLTREEITFAWLKTGWDKSKTGNLGATECFEALREQCATFGLAMKMDDLVGLISFVWAVLSNEGKLLKDKDLLRANVLRSMAADLAANWGTISDTCVEVLGVLRDRGYEYRDQYTSLNVIGVLWAWATIATSWERAPGRSVVQRDEMAKRLAKLLEKELDTWILVTDWAGVWTSASGASMERFGADLHSAAVATRAAASPSEAAAALETTIDTWLLGLTPDALRAIDELFASDRERVRTYYNALWIWHRLDAQRWEKSTINLKVGTKRPFLDVDHVVPFALWDDALEAAGIDPDSLSATVNDIGNCILLEKNFNISKGKKSTREFLESVHDFKDGTLSIEDWSQTLDLDIALVDANVNDLQSLSDRIRERSDAIKTDLREFVRRGRKRADLVSNQTTGAS